ncbi:MAG TPA: hypothetical protein VME46_22905 [Acidimicrobiales bacterium]|nr:hypothetical protein [Acidimicrobiales bacterium]
MKGHKRFRDGAWRLVVAAPTDTLTGKRQNVYETLHAPNNRAGAKLADARLAELIVAYGDVPSRPFDAQLQLHLALTGVMEVGPPVQPLLAPSP